MSVKHCLIIGCCVDSYHRLGADLGPRFLSVTDELLSTKQAVQEVSIQYPVASPDLGNHRIIE